MNTLTIKVEGRKELEAYLKAFPAEFEKETKRSLKKAASPHLKYIKAHMPVPKWNSTIPIKAKISKSRKGVVWLDFGMYGKAGSKDFEFMKAYWMNYGTLRRRSRTHRFQNPIKPNKRRRNEDGQYAVGFFEDATSGSADRIAHEVEKDLEKFVEVQNMK